MKKLEIFSATDWGNSWFFSPKWLTKFAIFSQRVTVEIYGFYQRTINKFREAFQWLIDEISDFFTRLIDLISDFFLTRMTTKNNDFHKRTIETFRDVFQHPPYEISNFFMRLIEEILDFSSRLTGGIRDFSSRQTGEFEIFYRDWLAKSAIILQQLSQWAIFINKWSTHVVHNDLRHFYTISDWCFAATDWKKLWFSVATVWLTNSAIFYREY